MYLRDKSDKPFVTIAYKQDQQDPNRIIFGYAVQNVKHDEWNRKLGRIKAEGRMKSVNEHISFHVPETFERCRTKGNVAFEIVQFIIESEKKFSSKVKRAAKRWYPKQ
jgi:hypothetical protein